MVVVFLLLMGTIILCLPIIYYAETTMQIHIDPSNGAISEAVVCGAILPDTVLEKRKCNEQKIWEGITPNKCAKHNLIKTHFYDLWDLFHTEKRAIDYQQKKGSGNIIRYLTWLISTFGTAHSISSSQYFYLYDFDYKLLFF